MNDKRKKLFAASIMLLIGAGIAGCAKSSDDASQKQVLKLSASAPLDTIDISKATGYGQTGNIFESFYRLGKDGKATPGLAKSGKVSKDGLTLTLNSGMPNGATVTRLRLTISSILGGGRSIRKQNPRTHICFQASKMLMKLRPES